MALRMSLKYTGITLLLWMMPHFAHAATGIHQTISWGVTWAITALNLGIWIIFTILMQLLDTSMFLGPDMVGVLNQVWILARDLVNIAFAVILIGTAVYTVITNNKDMIAEHMKKFVLAIILVNFSWFIPRVIIDVANVTAATIFDMPSMIKVDEVDCTYRSSIQFSLDNKTAAETCPETDPAVNPSQYDCECAAVINAKFFLSEKDAAALDPKEGWTPILAESMYLRLTALSNIGNSAPSSTILNGLIINHARLMGLATVPPSVQNDEITSLIMFLLKEAIVLLLHIALFFPLAAMMLAFAIRIPILWLTMAFMPFMVLQFVVPEKLTEGYPQKIWEHFLKAAFLPAIVAIPLTVGFIMTNAAQSAGIFNNLRGVDLPLTGNISDFQTLLWLIMTIGILWVGVFSTLEKMGAMSMGSQAIKSVGESLGGIVAKAPLYTPLPGGISPMEMGRTFDPRRIKASLDSTGDFGETWKDLTSGGRSTDMALSAQNHAPDNAKLNELDKDMKTLIKAVEDGNRAEEKRLHDKIGRDFGAPIKNNEDAISFVTELKKTGKADAAVMTSLEDSQNKLRAALKPTTP